MRALPGVPNCVEDKLFGGRYLLHLLLSQEVLQVKAKGVGPRWIGKVAKSSIEVKARKVINLTASAVPTKDVSQRANIHLNPPNGLSRRQKRHIVQRGGGTFKPSAVAKS